MPSMDSATSAEVEDPSQMEISSLATKELNVPASRSGSPEGLQSPVSKEETDLSDRPMFNELHTPAQEEVSIPAAASINIPQEVACLVGDKELKSGSLADGPTPAVLGACDEVQILRVVDSSAQVWTCSRCHIPLSALLKSPAQVSKISEPCCFSSPVCVCKLL